MARVIIGHGYTNLRPTEHWQRHLALGARQRGHQVFYPQFPAPHAPVVADWQDLLIAETQLAADLKEAGELLFVGHSLGSVNWILAAGQGILPSRFDRVLLVAPAAPELLTIAPGFSPDLENESFVANVHAAAGSIELVGSDKDPWSPRGIQQTYAEPLGLPVQIIEGAKHFSRDDGFGPWQGVIDWIDSPEANLAIR